MCKVLLVEDEKRITDSLSEVLKRQKFEVLVANSGMDALEMAHSVLPDIVVTDLMMPGMDGHEFLKKFKETISKDIPFIVITAKSSYSDIRNAMDEGFDDYLTKPFKTVDLINAINKRIERKFEFTSPLNEKVNRFEDAIKLITNHEFNTPMTAIKGFADLISYSGYDLKKNELKEYIEYIHAGAERLIRLFERLRLWQQLERKAVECKKESFLIDHSYISNILLKNNKYADKASSILVNAASVQIFSCKYLLEILLYELTDNAIKFSKSDTPIIISVNKISEGVLFSFSNHNIYITNDQINKYKPFQQYNRPEQEQQGVGIGLAIVNLITQFLNGSINYSLVDNVLTIQIKIKNHDE
jgi:two-component system sensor kinase